MPRDVRVAAVAAVYRPNNVTVYQTVVYTYVYTVSLSVHQHINTKNNYCENIIRNMQENNGDRRWEYKNRIIATFEGIIRSNLVTKDT